MESIDKFGTIWLSITYDCNNRCKWCYAGSNYNAYKGNALPIERQTPILDFLKSLDTKYMILIGGEPTVYPSVVDLVEKISKNGIHPNIVTNGRKFADRGFARAMKNAGLNFAAFSIEGYSPEVHDAGTCVKGSFDETLKGLENAIESGIKVSTNTTIARDNMDTLDKVVDILEKYNLHEVTFNICGICIRKDSNTKNSLSPKEGVKAFEDMYKYAKNINYRHKLKLVTPVPICNFSQDVLESLKKEKAISGRCQMVPGRNFVIDYDGSILPCTHFSGFPMFNLFNDNKIMSKEEFIAEYNRADGMGNILRKKVRHYASSKCNNCPEFCCGGCPLYWLKYNPDKEIRGLK